MSQPWCTFSQLHWVCVRHVCFTDPPCLWIMKGLTWMRKSSSTLQVAHTANLWVHRDIEMWAWNTGQCLSNPSSHRNFRALKPWMRGQHGTEWRVWGGLCTRLCLEGYGLTEGVGSEAWARESFQIQKMRPSKGCRLCATPGWGSLLDIWLCQSRLCPNCSLRAREHWILFQHFLHLAEASYCGCLASLCLSTSVTSKI